MAQTAPSEQFLDELGAAIGVSLAALKERKAYLDLTADDLQLLRDLGQQLPQLSSAPFLDNFYTHLQGFPAVVVLLARGAPLETLKAQQRQYLAQLWSGDYGEEYVRGRLHLGAVHQAIGLEPRWYIGAYSSYLCNLIDVLCTAECCSPAQRPVAIRALLKVAFFDLSLVLETYFHAQTAQLQAIMDHVPEPLITLDSAGVIRSFNTAAERAFGYRADEILGQHVAILMPEPDRLRHQNSLAQYFDTPEDGRFAEAFREFKGVRKNGEIFPIELLVSDIKLGGQRQFIGVLRDVTQRERAEAEWRKLSSALDQTADSIMITDADGIIEYVNPGFEHTTGYSRADAIGQRPNLLKSGLMDQPFYERLWKTLRDGKSFRGIFHNRHKDGSLYFEERTITPLRDAQGVVTHFVSNGRDITERIHSEEKLRFLAQHDVLTELPNRLLFNDRLTQAITRAERRGRRLALLFLDLDRFKVINDTLGHTTGDSLLCQVGQRLRYCLRSEDTVARISGDEFAVLLEDLSSNDEVVPIAQKLLTQVASPIQVDGRNLLVTTSMGIAVYPDDGSDSATLLRHSDIAMYRAKTRGRNGFHFYTPAINAMAEDRLELEIDLRGAAERGELELHYQPQLHLSRRIITGAEALLRWRSRTRGLIQPEEFVPLLEETGLIVDTGTWVMREACKQLRAWQAAGLSVPRVAVNISPRQLSDQGFAQKVQNVLFESGLPIGALDLEITESLVLEDETTAASVLRTLSDQSVGIAMDDFGTGYSSLSTLRRLPVRTLKIDRSFVREVPNDLSDAAMVRAIIALGHGLGLEVLAEGVETADQLYFLHQSECDAVQGFLVSRALPPEEFAARMATPENMLQWANPRRGMH